VRRSAVVPALLLMMIGAPAAQGQTTAPTCLGREATIVGTPGDDTIIVPDTGEVVVARGGNDVVYGGAEQDEICGGRGADVLYAGGGSDGTLAGGRGDDQLYGGPGEYDGIRGGPGDDLLDGGAGFGDGLSYAGSAHGVHVNLLRDRAYGEGTDILVGESFEDLVGSEYDDTLIGGEAPYLGGITGLGGDDFIKVTSGVGSVHAGDGNDIIKFTLGKTTDGISTGSGDDVLIGTAGNDDFSEMGGPGADTVFGRGGDDELNVVDGAGDDTVVGGDGTDSCEFDPGDVVKSCEPAP
jgi:Ca2+-binding RTX toxin-like protein